MTATLERGAAASPSATHRKQRPRLSDRARQERRLGWSLSMPAFVVMLLVVLYPIIDAVYLSFFNDRLTDPNGRAFIGLRNYGVILTDGTWWKAVLISTLVMVITVAIEFVLGFALAMVMNRILIPRRTLRTIVLIPYSIITVVSAYGFQYAFAPDSGWISHFFNWISIGNFDPDFDWFGHTPTALIAIMVSEVWKTTPFMSLLLLAGLAQVPGDLQEAAEVDGATLWERLRKVTLPAMKASILVALLFRSLDAFRIYDNIAIMTKGAQGTSSVAILAVNQTITRSEVGLGSAISVLLFILVIIISFIFIKGFRTDLSRARGDG